MRPASQIGQRCEPPCCTYNSSRIDRAASNQRSSQSAGGIAPFGGSSSSRPRSSGWSASEPDAASSQPDGGYTGSARESRSLSDIAGTGESCTDPTEAGEPFRGVVGTLGL